MTALISALRPAHAALALLLTLAAPATAQAQQADPVTPSVVRVTGEGRASRVPDLALLSLGVRTEAADAAEALRANSAAVGAVIAALRDAGIGERDMQTANLSIEPRYVYPPADDRGVQPDPKLVGYAVENRLALRVRDIAKLGTILDRAVSLGVNTAGGITFALSDPASAMTEARRAAVADARARADVLADAAGVSLGRLVELTEHSGTVQPKMAAERMMTAADGVPVERGESEIIVSVGAVWAVEPR